MLLASKLRSIVDQRGISKRILNPNLSAIDIIHSKDNNSNNFPPKFGYQYNNNFESYSKYPYSYNASQAQRYIHSSDSSKGPPHIHIDQIEFSTLVELQQKACKKFKEKSLFGTKYRDNFNWMTYKEFNFQVASMRYVLDKHNIMKHDRVAIISNNRVEWAVTMYAAMSLGAQVVPMYESQQEKDWKFILEDSRAKLLFVANEKIREQVKWYPENVGCVENILVFDRGDNCLHNLPR